MSQLLASFDLTPQWLGLMKKHIFADATLLNVESVGVELVVKPGSGLLSPKLLQPLVNYYTSYNYPLFDEGQGGAFVAALIDGLAATPWDCMDFGPVPMDSHIYRELCSAFSAIGYHSSGSLHHVNWYLEVAPGGYEAYLAQRPSQLRNTIKRKQKALQKTPDIDVNIFTGSEAAAHIADFQTVYEHSWKNSEPYPEFIAEMVASFAALGWVRLGVIYHQQSPIAAQLWIVKGGVASIYKLAYVEGHEKLSAGTVLMAKMMAHVIDQDQVSRVDFLVGDEPYKREWMSNSRQVYGIRIYNSRTVKGRLLALWSALKNRIKPWLKR